MSNMEISLTLFQLYYISKITYITVYFYFGYLKGDIHRQITD